MDSMILNKKMYLLDGSCISGITPYVDINSVMKHPLWGSHLLLNNEDIVICGHKDYIRAGADFLTTITYQASIEGFQKYLNLDYDQSFELIKKSVMICRRAIIEENEERNIQIMGSVGPYGASLCDCSEYNALVEAGVDIILFETIPSVTEATILLNILAEFPNQKACLSFSCKDGNYLSHGEEFSSAVEMFWSNNYRKQLIAIGMNCLHPKFITPLLMSVKTKNVNFITYPNGGGIWDVAKNCYDDTQIYKVSIDDLKIWNQIGLKIFGGCCKTDAIEIARLRSLIDDLLL
ncbi:homocysteine S-methyltransferase YbgG-like isoform X2 [Melanaphis sacchari]|uniref:homocysteine S-methyltransferase YbgG-like isoform X2 n=1 Tax=Melanaphis sacchari TaxID=742174 RepID=UPI000DC131F4|nr:homocysteine S-methyltransferase YbgG-like isoform X2 [Melanaphis sacchari]